MTTHSEDSQKETKGDSKRAPEKNKKICWNVDMIPDFFC